MGCSWLPCFDPELYFVTWEYLDSKCIATTKRRTRCARSIHSRDAEKIAKLCVELADPSSTTKLELCEGIVLLRTCSHPHRKKLEANAECLTALARRYLASFRYATAGLPKLQLTPPKERSLDTPSTGIRYEPRVEPCPYYNLRPRQTTQSPNVANERLLAAGEDVFVPYSKANRKPTVRQLLLQNIATGRYGDAGSVYVLKWSRDPRYLKIGYTAVSVEKRVQAWKRCHPGIQVVHSAAIAFPRRFEKLIHTELADHRMKIVVCPKCSGTHHEWFEISEDIAVSTIGRWKKLQEAGMFYTPRGHLHTHWQTMLDEGSLPTVLSSTILLQGMSLFPAGTQPSFRKPGYDQDSARGKEPAQVIIRAKIALVAPSTEAIVPRRQDKIIAVDSVAKVMTPARLGLDCPENGSEEQQQLERVSSPAKTAIKAYDANLPRSGRISESIHAVCRTLLSTFGPEQVSKHTADCNPRKHHSWDDILDYFAAFVHLINSI